MKLKPILLLGIAGGVVAAVKKRAGAGDDQSGGAETPRYAAPAEAGSQPPAEAGGAPSDATQVRSTVPDTEDALATKAHDLPDDTVMPDTSADDPSVQEAEAAAGSDAAQIGGKTEEPEVP